MLPTYVALWVDNVLFIVLSAFAFLYSQSVVAWLMYSRRSELGLYTVDSPEQEAAHAAIAEAHAQDDLLVHLAELCARRQLDTAYGKLVDYIEQDISRLDPVMHERLSHFAYQQIYLEHAVHYLHRLYENDERRKAWAVLRECVQKDERFRPLDDETLLALTRFAGKEDAHLVAMLLADFERAYPESERVPDALFRHARVLIELLNYRDRGIEVLERLVTDFSHFPSIAEVQTYLAKSISNDRG